ncbi:beta-ketoacyl-ACP synthase III [Alkalispirochaeta americana]|nr:beta-ketoacyl-ACP synthase III [Alkalispirochaeta americana]
MNTILRPVAVTGVGAFAPERRVHNEDLAQMVDTSDEWIFSHTGIRYRHIASEDQAASDLAVPAAKKAMAKAGVSPDDIDLILVATSTPDYPGLPSTACVLQEKLGIPSAGAMDLVAACSGFIYGLETARTYVAAGAARNVLVVGSEIYSRIVNWEDRGSSVLFGDGAGAAVVSVLSEGENRISPAILGSRGSGAESLCRLYGGTRHPYIPGVTPPEALLLQMDGKKVYTFAVAVIVQVIQDLLDQNGLTFSDLAYVVPHQANTRIIAAAAKRGGWDADRFYMNIEEYANTSAASIPLALDEMNEKGLLAPGDRVLCVGFGSGLTYGGTLITWG